jgi:transcriptional regulator with XRE-family HTH domain
VTAPRAAEPVTARIGRNVRTARLARGWSQEQLARALVLTGRPAKRSGVADLESGRRREIGVSLLVALAVALHVPVSELLGDPGRCGTCHGRPQRRFKCLDCGTETIR